LVVIGLSLLLVVIIIRCLPGWLLLVAVAIASLLVGWLPLLVCRLLVWLLSPPLLVAVGCCLLVGHCWFAVAFASVGLVATVGFLRHIAAIASCRFAFAGFCLLLLLAFRCCRCGCLPLLGLLVSSSLFKVAIAGCHWLLSLSLLSVIVIVVVIGFKVVIIGLLPVGLQWPVIVIAIVNVMVIFGCHCRCSATLLAGYWLLSLSRRHCRLSPFAAGWLAIVIVIVVRSVCRCHCQSLSLPLPFATGHWLSLLLSLLRHWPACSSSPLSCHCWFCPLVGWVIVIAGYFAGCLSLVFRCCRRYCHFFAVGYCCYYYAGCLVAAVGCHCRLLSLLLSYCCCPLSAIIPACRFSLSVSSPVCQATAGSLVVAFVAVVIVVKQYSLLFRWFATVYT
jgi:hypothetical protein